MENKIFWILFFVGWTLFIVGYVRSYQMCPPCEVEHKYISRKLLDEQLSDNNDSASLLYSTIEKAYESRLL